MKNNILIRLVDVDDLTELSFIDQAYAKKYNLEPVVSLGSLNFYSRSGHSFASLKDGRHSGFVFAHAIWSGAKAVLQVSRMALTEDDDAVSAALIEAVLKSAYDAAVYDLQVLQPDKDNSGLEAFVAKDFIISKTTLLSRKLGSV